MPWRLSWLRPWPLSSSGRTSGTRRSHRAGPRRRPKREEARRILAEADGQVAETERMRLWLDRESGRSALGHFPFEQMALPASEPDLVHAASAIEEVSDAA